MAINSTKNTTAVKKPNYTRLNPFENVKMTFTAEDIDKLLVLDTKPKAAATTVPSETVANTQSTVSTPLIPLTQNPFTAIHFVIPVVGKESIRPIVNDATGFILFCSKYILLA